MKKILAMFVAFACTLGAFADGIQANISGTDFSTYPVGVFTPGLNDSGKNDGKSYWHTGFADDLDAEVVNVSSNEETGAVNYLAFESNVTNPLYRTVHDCYGSVEDGILKDSAGQAITNAFFIDTTVQFTPYLVNENHPAPTKTSDDDKIIVWVRETEIPEGEGQCETNLIVTAGYIVGAGVQPKDYVVQMTPADVSALCQGRHRLTIKAFENITKVSGVTVMGFVVYIDGIAVSYSSSEAAFNDAAATYVQLAPTPALYYKEGTHQLFPSMVTPHMGQDEETAAEYASITAVGFAGMGQIGEVWFDDYNTAYPEFAGDDINFTVVVGEGVRSFEYDGKTYTKTTPFAVAPGTTNIVITNVMYNTGWSAKAGTWYAGKTQVNNSGDPEGDYGVFSLELGVYEFTLAGFKANYEVSVAGVPTSYQTLFGDNGALKAALDNGGMLKLLSDITIDEAEEFNLEIGETEELILDLNGKTIQGTTSIDATIVNNGKLTIFDGSSEKTGRVWGPASSGYYAIENQGTLIILSGEFGYMENGEYAISMTIKGGTFLDAERDPDEEPTKEDFYLYEMVDNTQYSMQWNASEVDGDIYWFFTIGEAVVPATPVAKIGKTEYTSLADAIAAATAESTIQIMANIDTDVAFVIQQQTVKIDLNGKTIKTTEKDTSGDGVFWVKTGGTLTITNTVGTGVINGVGGNNWNIGIFADGGKVIINGGNFTNEGATDPQNSDHFDLIYVKNGGIVEITGGTFKCETPRWTLNKKNETEGSFVVTGGKFYGYDPTNIDTDDVDINGDDIKSWCPAGYKATLGNDGYYTVEEITDPWAPAAENDDAAQDKVAEIFEGYPAATNITTYAQYTNLVAYVKAVKKDVVDFNEPEDLSDVEKLYIVDSLKLGAHKLFEAEPKVEVTSVTPDTTAGNWKFEVTVTEDKGTGAIEVAVAREKIEALVKVSTDLKTWGPAETTAVMVGNKVSVTVNFGDGTTGFMKISE